jgi:hypothetical protein
MLNINHWQCQQLFLTHPTLSSFELHTMLVEKLHDSCYTHISKVHIHKDFICVTFGSISNMIQTWKSNIVLENIQVNVCKRLLPFDFILIRF